ncbi:hypothetical protein MAPG_09852 [Magnaporthiopsis poae ATCC 64411]|uniref:Uncharacterized protein n=1 Tax=Magnaporthiopsis poae (strain ATCC 64411 / 73-15) TaxID=644358 RepID=A0A0C4EB12_MAGP6|nr:hypothetical protein MAPG_09852 [Magnaporthiopsis poae ATCC 64411]
MAPATPSRPAAGLQFVMESAATGKTNPDTRKLIRRHVMLGKNTGKVRPPRNPAPPSPKRNRSPRSSGAEDAGDSALVQAQGSGTETWGGTTPTNGMGQVTVPPPFGHVLAALTLPPDVQLNSVVLFLQCEHLICMIPAVPCPHHFSLPWRR